MSNTTLCAAALLVALALPLGSGCAATGGGTAARAGGSVERRLLGLRTVVRELRASESGVRTQMEIDQAESWLQRAELRLAARDDEALEDARLLVDAAEGQLVKVRTLHTRLAAQLALETERQGYERLSQDIERLREQNRALQRSTQGDRR